MTARRLSSPAVLMTVYVAAFICGGPWLGSDPARRNVPQIAIAVLLAVLAARGSRSARILMTSYSVLGAFAVLYSSTHWGPSEPVADSFLALACALVQIGLLVGARRCMSEPLDPDGRRANSSPVRGCLGRTCPWCW